MVFENDNGMTVVHGELDPVAGKQLAQAIAAETDRLFQLDGGRGHADQVRTCEQRRADALCALITGTARSDGARPPVRNQMIALFTANDGEPVEGRLVEGTPLPASVIERLACGSDLFGLVLSAGGDPLWAGRRTRLATDAGNPFGLLRVSAPPKRRSWRALIARDGGCVSCGADPSRCEAHHVVVWQPPGNGPTDIDNLVLLCRHHHHLVHDDGWALSRDGTDGWLLQPP